MIKIQTIAGACTSRLLIELSEADITLVTGHDLFSCTVGELGGALFQVPEKNAELNYMQRRLPWAT